MKPTSPLSLLLFIQLATSSPIPLSHRTLTSTRCTYASCRGSISTAVDGPNTPPSRIVLSPQHLAEHSSPSSSSFEDLLEELIIDNHPITPTSESDSLDTLTAERPLSSAFLLSLARPASLIKVGPEDTSKNALPSNIPALRKEDLDRYLDSTSTEIQVTREGEVVEDATPRTNCGRFEFTLLPKGYRMRQKATYVVREYSDVLVVAVVLLFLLTVVCVEAVEQFGSVSAIFFGQRRTPRGAIFLDEEKSLNLHNNNNNPSKLSLYLPYFSSKKPHHP